MPYRTAAVPLSLARTEAFLLARDAVNAAFTLFIASGLALYTWTPGVGVEDNVCVLLGGSVSVPEEGDAS